MLLDLKDFSLLFTFLRAHAHLKKQQQLTITSLTSHTHLSPCDQGTKTFNLTPLWEGGERGGAQQSTPCLLRIHHTWPSLGGGCTTNRITQNAQHAVTMLTAPRPKLLNPGPNLFSNFPQTLDPFGFFSMALCRDCHSQLEKPLTQNG